MGNYIRHPDEDGQRQCTDCKEVKPLEAFSKTVGIDRGGKPRRRSQCILCRTARDKNTTLLRVYGITLDDYNRMVEEQQGLCALCGRPETCKDKESLSVDHNHETGQVRQLLCHRCNMAVGLIGEDTDLCVRIAQYLEKHKSNESKGTGQ